jgi:hypothetical protein
VNFDPARVSVLSQQNHLVIDRVCHIGHCGGCRASPSIRQHGTASPDHAPTRLGCRLPVRKYSRYASSSRGGKGRPSNSVARVTVLPRRRTIAGDIQASWSWHGGPYPRGLGGRRSATCAIRAGSISTDVACDNAIGSISTKEW